ncbi:hypothetical protein KQX54_000154 [Cotesia glomerata]|uniref:Uncharacterized protein n=1 Tax=Cotesia glomerata TaxID=32391 RepID=A0AAV7IXK7_COTGL|nr:hypothetical protein KQX54_000154 [Cotesia glomerata]
MIDAGRCLSTIGGMSSRPLETLLGSFFRTFVTSAGAQKRLSPDAWRVTRICRSDFRRQRWLCRAVVCSKFMNFLSDELPLWRLLLLWLSVPMFATWESYHAFKVGWSQHSIDFGKKKRMSFTVVDLLKQICPVAGSRFNEFLIIDVVVDFILRFYFGSFLINRASIVDLNVREISRFLVDGECLVSCVLLMCSESSKSFGEFFPFCRFVSVSLFLIFAKQRVKRSIIDADWAG